MKRKVKLTTRHGLHWTLDKGVRVALQALTHKARATFDGFAAGRKPGLPDTGQMSAEQIIENLRAVESMAGSLASQMETNLRMNRWREHLGDDPLDGFGGRGPAEYHYMATHEPEGPGLTRFGNLQLPDDALTLHGIAQDAYNRALAPRDTTCNPNDAMHEAVDAVLDALHDPAPPRGEGDDLAARFDALFCELRGWCANNAPEDLQAVFIERPTGGFNNPTLYQANGIIQVAMMRGLIALYPHPPTVFEISQRNNRRD